MTIDRDPNYCSTCYNAAKKARRPVRQTDVFDFPICPVCEARIRNGLVHYRPSNGTEFHMFEARCERCRHYNEEGAIDPTVKACKWGVLDKLLNGKFADDDAPTLWFDPADLRDGCPAECLRFTDERDGDGPRRDPPPKDCIGQMTFGEIDVPVERAAAAVKA